MENLNGTPSTLASFDISKNNDASEGLTLTEKTLLSLSDAVRLNLLQTKTLGPRAGEVRAFLGDMVKREYETKPSIHFSTIKNARLDKLLSDILKPANRPFQLPIQARADIAIARSLQRQWRARYREAYFDIDQTRYETLAKTGRLNNVIFNDTGNNLYHPWAPQSYSSLSGIEINRPLEVGQ
ncbi:hypothetical protein S40285_01160 [Stachybotrys chlorohalonatus IBT 40285]|uniref:Uncharacterized protein n=1 Tax=Stachybotrys chlorohalonatus (strain IBT 40285) TaxID=1283841 RepID=A0A084QXW6_STAC4|nr:hypothetical protein S40285_01160 [Stachybotrys chlorohalonata IBT 40285]